MTKKVQIEFTDRYGGRTPSWLRGCHGQCEAMGVVPIKGDDYTQPWRTLWLEAERENHTDDGWHFVKCPECRGTGRVSWMQTIRRIPRWLNRAIRQTISFTSETHCLMHGEPLLKRFLFALKICVWQDIARLRN